MKKYETFSLMGTKIISKKGQTLYGDNIGFTNTHLCEFIKLLGVFMKKLNS